MIRSTFYAASDAADIPENVSMQMADIFEGQLDFRRGLRKGDRFAVVYESLEADGEPLRAGRVLSTEFLNNGKAHQAIWFQEEGKKGSYYTLDGKSLQQAYLSYPVEFSRISSNFSMRLHPIQKTWRAHLGTDFAAPTGTKVRTVGDGTVSFAGVQNGYGNVIFVEHANQHTTVYAHLSRIDVRQGQHVDQGDIIGAVGSTGWATGPTCTLNSAKGRTARSADHCPDHRRGQAHQQICSRSLDKQAAQMRIELNAGTQAVAVASAR